MRLEDHVAALAAMGDEHDETLAAATRLRIRGSLERGHAWRRHASVLAALAIMLVASGAWALATGRLQRWIARPHATLPATRAPAPAIAHAPSVMHASAEPAPLVAPAEPAPIVAPAEPAHVAAHAPAVVPTKVVPTPVSAHAPVVAPIEPAPIVAPAPPAGTSAAHATRVATTAEVAPDPADALYTRAHELHFRGGAPADALAAWDAYLAAAPHGQLAIEARYNRALCLVRLGRLAEARTALDPFAHGTVEPAGYRQSDAAQLIERIDRRLNGTR